MTIIHEGNESKKQEQSLSDSSKGIINPQGTKDSWYKFNWSYIEKLIIHMEPNFKPQELVKNISCAGKKQII